MTKINYILFIDNKMEKNNLAQDKNPDKISEKNIQN
jgi:hypothetical protein